MLSIFYVIIRCLVMCENTLDEKKKTSSIDVFRSIMLIALWHQWSTTTTTVTESNYPSWGINVHWHWRATTGVRSQMNTDTLNWKCYYLESKYMSIIINETSFYVMKAREMNIFLNALNWNWAVDKLMLKLINWSYISCIKWNQSILFLSKQKKERDYESIVPRVITRFLYFKRINLDDHMSNI